jgi:hypothetical protein
MFFSIRQNLAIAADLAILGAFYGTIPLLFRKLSCGSFRRNLKNYKNDGFTVDSINLSNYNKGNLKSKANDFRKRYHMVSVVRISGF